ncbi:hypothetical protein [Lentzea guizhouensis]|uniref:hypothetical protein n=1 Tax=Lentzea guizhouensis TaxID=1586287 RepID=UPI0012B6A943|nr:hypothetical protein [Lentzea guizhouensis]
MQYLEPRTDVAAKDDWSTGLILQDLGSGAKALGSVGLGAAAGLVGCLFLPMTPGNVAAVVVLGLIVLLGSLGPVMYRVESKPVRRGLLEQPWRRCPATVAEQDLTDRVRLADGTVLRGWFEDLPEMVLDRQEVFVAGPDADGHAVIRAAGFAKMHNAKVDTGSEFHERERVERPLMRPLDDDEVVKAFNGLVWGTRSWLWAAIPAGVGAVLVLLSFFPLAVSGLVVGGLLLVPALLGIPMALEISRWYRNAVQAVQNSNQWTPVSVTLFPWQPNQHVAGLADMPGGLALVQFVVPELDVIANIADTGVMWVAGTHDDLIAVGVPRVPTLTFAVVQPDRDTPREDPVPWIQRLQQPDFSRLPR